VLLKTTYLDLRNPTSKGKKKGKTKREGNKKRGKKEKR